MSFANRARLRLVLATIAIAALAGATVGLLSGGTTPASAATGEPTIIQDAAALANNPTRTLQIFRSLGVEIIRVPLVWNSVAADPSSRTEPTNPYPDADWVGYDTLLAEAQLYGIRVDLMPTGPAPLWATTPGAPNGFAPVWKPSAAAYGAFVDAAATRYTGNYIPAGEAAPLARINFWELWNEGNWSPSLAPQVPTTGSASYVSAAEDRSLIDQAYVALEQTGHAHDTIVEASLSPDQSQVVVPASQGSVAPPLAFLRDLYCVDPAYHRLQGAAAAALGCPTTSAASQQFASKNPGLFRSTGIGVHPYGYGNPPTIAAFQNPDSVEFAGIPALIRALGRIQRTYGASKSLAIYNTEYGYEPRPPQRNAQFPTPTTAASYLNWAEYLSYKNPRIASYDQYLLYDGSDWFTTGLIAKGLKLLPSFYAFRMPLWLPVTSTKRGRSLEVWGCVRPAHNATVDTGQAQYVEIQFARGSSGSFRNLTSLRITNSDGYFDTRINFPSSGQVRLAWEYPQGDTLLADPLLPGQSWIYSRTMSITLR